MTPEESARIDKCRKMLKKKIEMNRQLNLRRGIRKLIDKPKTKMGIHSPNLNLLQGLNSDHSRGYLGSDNEITSNNSTKDNAKLA